MRLFDASEFLIQPEEGEAKSVVVDAELMQDRGVEVANVNRICDNVVAVVICFTMRDAATDTATNIA